MKRIFKLLLGLLGAFVLLLLAAAVVLPMIYDTEDLKQAIASQVNQRTGRNLSIDGALDFSVFPWLAVEVRELRLSNADGFGNQDFAHVGEARVGVALMPLLHKQIVVDEVTLKGLELKLMVNARGQNNWDDLAGADETDASAGSEGELFSSRRIAGLNIREAQIEFQDQKAGTHYRLSDLSLQTGALGDGDPLPFEMESRVEDVISGSRSQLSLSTTVSVDLKSRRYAFERVELSVKPDPASGQASTPAILFQAPLIRADLEAQTLEVASFAAELADLAAGGDLAARNILNDPEFSGTVNIAPFSPARLMEALQMKTPDTSDPQALQHALLSARFAGNNQQVRLSDLQLELDQSHFSGEMTIRNFDEPRIGFDLAVDEIDVDRYLEPANADSAQEEVAIPSEELRGPEVVGNLTIGKLRLAGLDFTAADVGVALREGKLRLHPLTAKFYDGRYAGDISLDSSGQTPRLTLNESIDAITLQSLVTDLVDTQLLSGTALGYIRLSGSGNNSNEMLRSLDGELGLSLTEGALEGINIWHEIRSGMARFKGLELPPPEPDRTIFSRMQLEGAVAKGVVNTRELIAELPFLTLRGKGTVDLGQSTVDLGLVAMVRNMPELANDPLSAELKGKSLPFRVSGALDNPSVSIDVEALLKSEAAGLLLDKLGLGAKPTPGEGADAEAGEQAADAEEAASSEDQLKEAAKGALFQLLGGKNKDKEKETDGDGL